MTEAGAPLRSIRFRLTFGTLALSLLSLALIAALLTYVSARTSSRALDERTEAQLRSLHALKSQELADIIAALGSATRTVASAGALAAEVEPLTRASAELVEQLRLRVPVDEQRRAVRAYYADDYEQEFARRNNDARSGLASVVADLPDLAVAMQYLYIARNPNPLGSKQLLQRSALDGSRYADVHARLQAEMRQIMNEYGFYDVFIVNLDGDLLYSYFKELDYGTNLRTGPFAQSGIGEAFRQAALAADPIGVYLTDFALYRPSYDDQAAFFSAPLFHNGRRVGVFIAQMPLDRLQAQANFGGAWEAVGLGVTGESILVGLDGFHRVSSRRLAQDADGYLARLAQRGITAEVLDRIRAKNSTIGQVRDGSTFIATALAGQSTVGRFDDYLGQPVVAAAGPVDVLNRRFAYALKIDQAEADAPTAALVRNAVLTALGLLTVIGLIAAWIALGLSRSITNPLDAFGRVVERVTRGERDARVRSTAPDEIGVLARAFDQMLDERDATQRRIEQENEDLNESVITIMTSLAELAQRDLTIKVPVSANVTGAVSDAINLTVRSTAEALGQVRDIATQVSGASSRVERRAVSVEEVAKSATEEATSASAEIQRTAMALRAIGQEAQKANEEAERAISATEDALELVRATVSGISSSRDQIRETEKRVKRLAERSQEITSIVQIIGQIAERTSVLALNASMQAVAAGEAGRGFAVVAEEVKRLAESARQATQQIAALVSAIRSDTQDTLQAMNNTIAQVVDISRLADRAGDQMGDTRQSTEQLVAAVRSITQATQAQNQAAQTLLTRAYELLQSSQRTIEEIEAQRQDAQVLTRSASALVQTVEQFRLPTTA